MADTNGKAPLADQERESESRAEADTESQAMDTGSQLVDEEQVDAAREEAVIGTEQAVPAELAAVRTDNESAKAADGAAVDHSVKQKGKQTRISNVRHRRSTKYTQVATKLSERRSYTLDEAIALVKETSYATFDAAVELHVRVERKKEGETLRGLLQLPHGTGKTVKAVVLTEGLIEQIAKTKKVNADILVASSELMPEVAKIAKILGPIGKMPSPKAGTVSENPDEIVKAVAAGRVEYRADSGGNVHVPIGKVSWTADELRENAEAVLGVLPKQLLSITLSATMGPGVRVHITNL